MATYAQQMTRLKRIIAIAEKLIAETPKPKMGRPAKTTRPAESTGKTRVRRTGKELIAFRRMLKAERSKGVSAASLAKKHSISLAYIYQL